MQNKTWLVVNTFDSNDVFEVEAADVHLANVEALSELGWFVSMGEEAAAEIIDVDKTAR